MEEKFDFKGWATKNDILCADGRTIRDGAFKENDGQIVPLVYMHNHTDPGNVIGHALLEYRPGEGMYCYASCNANKKSQEVKEAVAHGDLRAFSIYANQLKQNGGDVVHGRIREVSVVLAGANDGAVIEYPILAHSGETVYDEAVIFAGDESLTMMHADSEKEDKKVADETKETAEPQNDKKPGGDKDKTVADVFNTFSEEQKKVVYYMIGQALEDQESETAKHSEEDEEDTTLTHNVFDQDEKAPANALSHADVMSLFETARKRQVGSLREFISDRAEDNEALAHAIDTTGMTVANGNQTYGFNDVSMLLPDYHNLNNPPEWISRDMGWVGKVMAAVHHTPFSRIKSQYANITEDEARAKGYIKAHQKKTEVFTTLKRVTEPQTVYKLQKLDRDDILDITDFDVVAWIKSEMRTMLDEELARAYLIGDGRESDAENKIKEGNIRPIATDVPLFNTKVLVDSAKGSTEEDKAKAAIKAIIRNRKNYKGSGNPTFYTTEDWLASFLLLEDGIGHALYKSVDELATKLRVKEIVTVEPMEGFKVDNKSLIGIIVNLADYNVGADKGAATETFEDFDIDFNQYKYLIETRCSGALVKPFSALTILDNEATA